MHRFSIATIRSCATTSAERTAAGRARPGNGTITGSTDGWKPVAYDLSGYAGEQVEVSLSYVTDPGTGGVGAFVDDTKIVVDGATDADSFEGQTSSWTVGDAPEDSPEPLNNWVIGGPLLNF